MTRGIIVVLTFVLAFTLCAASAMGAPSIDPALVKAVNANPQALTPVMITFTRKPSSIEFTQLRALGIKGGIYFNALPMLITVVNRSQLDALSRRSDVRSIYANHKLNLLDDRSRPFIGVTALRSDNQTTARNHGFPISGNGVGIAYVDTGIDGTHPDLQLGKNLAGNVNFPLAEQTAVEIASFNQFAPVIAIENIPNSDIEGGHGTFGAGVAAGTGQASGGFYGGMAPGAKLLGLVAGNDAGLTSFGIVQAYDYALVNQFRYNIRVCNNSWGTTIANVPFDPNDPINVATLSLHDHNITVVFAAGNDGDAPDVINPYSVAPWTISVAAGDKEYKGSPAGFSSRGNDNGTGYDVAGMPGDPSLAPNLRPDIIGSGVNIKSTRLKGPGETNIAGTVPYLGNDANTIPPAYLPYYTTSQGTSFSTPQVTGIVALMMEANPLLTPDDVVTILRQTATPMPYEQRVVGAGYVDAHNAVRVAMGLAQVAHPANLMLNPGDAQVNDPAGDTGGNAAQDVLTGRFQYDAGDPANSVEPAIVYTMNVVDLSAKQPNNAWLMSSNWRNPDTGAVINIFVSVEEDAALGEFYDAGMIAPDPQTGVNTQTSLANSGVTGQMVGNQIIIRLPIRAINEAIFGAGTTRSVVGMTSTGTEADAQQLVGAFGGGLLVFPDTAGGVDFKVGP
ncbi:MAG TPA: S8 family serine peptidase [Pyrinomonadaceae bacterium]|nr:S8 family serine peptidase [Pyrinomonadaceae bacterium]